MKSTEQKIQDKAIKIKNNIINREIYLRGSWVNFTENIKFYSNDEQNYFVLEINQIKLTFYTDKIKIEFNLPIPLTKVLSVLNKTLTEVKKLSNKKAEELRKSELNKLLLQKEDINKRIRELKVKSKK